MKYLAIAFCFVTQMCSAQELALIKLSKEEVNKNIQYHFSQESTEGHLAAIDLFLFKDQTFEYSIASNVYQAYSIGRWKLDNNKITLNSDFQDGTLPINVSYRQRDSSDLDVKQIAFVRDLNQKILSYAFVHINNDSTSCMDGDLLCTGKYKQIDRVKIALENNGPSSKWINVMPQDGLLQITVLTNRNLKNYIILKNKKYAFENTKLRQLGDK